MLMQELFESGYQGILFIAKYYLYGAAGNQFLVFDFLSALINPIVSVWSF